MGNKQYNREAKLDTNCQHCAIILESYVRTLFLTFKLLILIVSREKQKQNLLCSKSRFDIEKKTLTAINPPSFVVPEGNELITLDLHDLQQPDLKRSN